MPTRQQRLDAEIRGKPLKPDTRKGDRHKPRPNHRGKKLTKWERKLVVAWDGEGKTLEDGSHIYNLLANSDGNWISDPRGISTKEALEFFLAQGNPDAINVIYGGSYDVNMILGDVPPEQIARLWHTGSCYWDEYRIIYAPRKKFTIQKFYKVNGKFHKYSFVLWDVLGYFQTTFVGACRKWLGDMPILDEIAAMKGERSKFTQEQFDDILDYCLKECELLVQLMHSLFNALDNAGIRLRRYDGAGSIASNLLGANKVVEHKGDPSEEVLRWAQHAYSGGRIEAVKIGNSEQPIWRYDINSAYPYSCLRLPSYKGAYWTFDSEWDGQDSSMVMLRWSLRKKDSKYFHPLWYREHDGTILYPDTGYGIYWGVEARNLIDRYPDRVDIISACNVHLATDEKPFAYLADIYHARLLLKERGDMANEAFKLGMNSTYGKLAQQAGYRNGRIPRYHQLLWAGQITAATRSQLYNAAMQKPSGIISFATDAVLSTARLDLPEGKGLGQWTADRFSAITIVQPGVYWLKSEGDWGEKYRGFDKGTLLREQIVECWRNGTDFTASLTRFIGMGAALMGPELSPKWRTWQTEDRVLSLMPSGKRLATPDCCYADSLCATIATPNVIGGSEIISKPYPLLWDDDSYPDMSVYDGLQEYENDLLDSYA